MVVMDKGSAPGLAQWHASRRARYGERLGRLARLAVDIQDKDTLLQHMLKSALECLDADHGIVYLLSADRLELQVAAGVGLLPGERLKASLRNKPDMLAGLVARDGRPHSLPSAPHEARISDDPAYRRTGLTTALAVPLFDGGRVSGVVAVRWRRTEHFGSDEVLFLETLSCLVAACLQRARRDEALSHSQRLKSVGQLTSGIAHDFNNLLTVISGNLQVLQDRPAIAGDPEGRSMVHAAAHAARRGAELTSKLMTLSRRQVLQPEAVDVPALLGTLGEVLGRTLDQRIRIVVDVAPDCPACRVDPGQLEAALLNIAINARDAMPDGGTLCFSASAVERIPAQAIAEAGGSARSYVAIRVRDNGSGMCDTVRQRALEPFFTTKENGHGTGLGLSTVCGFVHQSNGAMAIDSAPGKGTTVALYLPQDPGPAVHGAGPAPRGNLPKGLRVLVVEDDDDVRNLVQSFLTAEGCKPTLCASAEHALALLENCGDRPPPFDLVFCDVALGAGMRGTALAALANRLSPPVPVLLVSGLASDLIHAPATWPLLKKPYSRAELIRAIARTLC